MAEWQISSSFRLYRGPSDVDLQLKTNMETLVIKWSQQINDVLKQDSSKSLETGNNPTPFVELSFWEERKSKFMNG